MQRRHFIVLMTIAVLLGAMWFVNQIQRSGLSRDHTNLYDAVSFDGADIVIDETKLATESTKEESPTCRLPAGAYARLESTYAAQDALSRQVAYLEAMNGGITRTTADTVSSHDFTEQPK